MDKVRQEFEKHNPIPAGVMRCGDSYAATDWGWVSQDYVKAFKQFKLGWKASRDMTVVKLPDYKREYQSSSHFEDGFGKGYNKSLNDVCDCLEDAGVRYE